MSLSLRRASMSSSSLSSSFAVKSSVDTDSAVLIDSDCPFDLVLLALLLLSKNIQLSQESAESKERTTLKLTQNHHRRGCCLCSRSRHRRRRVRLTNKNKLYMFRDTSRDMSHSYKQSTTYQIPDLPGSCRPNSDP